MNSEVKIENNAQALISAMVLAITAPNDKKSKQALEYVEAISSIMTPNEIEACKIATMLAVDEFYNLKD